MAHSENWNPNLYLKFKKERTQPSIDLVNRIKINNPKRIVDLGCGPGNSTEILKNRWDDAEILGVDKSPEMIEKAKIDYPNQSWTIADITAWKSDIKYDVIFANATLQWIPDQEKVINKLFNMLSETGCLAVQVPANYDSPLHQAVLETAREPEFAQYNSDCSGKIFYHDEEFYYEILTKMSSFLNIWTTSYYHILNDYKDLIEWYKGTGLKIYLEALPDDKARHKFEKSVLEKSTKRYKKQSDGKIIFGFKRLFFTVYK